MTTPSIQTKRADPLTNHLPHSNDHTLRLRRLEAQIHILDAAMRVIVQLLDQPEQRRSADTVRRLLDELHD
jgi:hypothetical protein